MPPRLYLLHGPDDFGSAEFLDGLKEKMGDPSMAALNTPLFDGRSVTLPDVRAICDTMPFLARRRLVIVEGWLTRLMSRADAGAAAAGAATEGIDEADEDASPSPTASMPAAAAAGQGASAHKILKELVDYLPSLPETTALVLLEKREVPERNALMKAAANAEWAFVKFFDLTKGEPLLRWIRNRAKTEGGEFSREAAEALAEVENDPRSLGNEILKLLTYVNFERPVELDDVQTLTPAGGEARVFDMVDAIGQRRAPHALRELHQLLQSAEPLYVLSMIVRQYRLMIQAKEMLAANASEAEISRTLSLAPYATGKACAQARNFSIESLEHLYHRLLDYDADVKTGQVDAVTALNTLVVAITAA